MWADKKYSGINRYIIERAVESLVEPNELCHEIHIWVGNLSSLSDVAEALIKSNLLFKYQIA